MQAVVKALGSNMVSYEDAYTFTANTSLNTYLNCEDMLMELARREKIAGIKPDEDLDIFMKVCDTSCTFFFFNLMLLPTVC